MDVRAGSATLAKTSTSTLAAPARSRARAPAIHRRSRCQHVIEEDEAPTGNGGFAVSRHAKCALNIGGAFGPRQADLLRRRFDAFEGAGNDRHAGLTRYDGRQHGRLIEAPRP
jgi:hypothetical protein